MTAATLLALGLILGANVGLFVAALLFATRERAL